MGCNKSNPLVEQKWKLVTKVRYYIGNFKIKFDSNTQKSIVELAEQYWGGFEGFATKIPWSVGDKGKIT